jgi:hypothetical protein
MLSVLIPDRLLTDHEMATLSGVMFAVVATSATFVSAFWLALIQRFRGFCRNDSLVMFIVVSLLV